MTRSLAIHGGTPARTTPFPTWPIFGATEEERLLAVLRSGKWGRIDGEEVDRFERRFADYCGTKHAIAAVNGTVTLRIALLAAGIKEGDEVIVPPFTFIATASAVVEANATPVFVDIEADTFNISPEAIENAITPRTRAIIAVHMGGQIANMDAIRTIAHRRGLVVIEDAAHAHGAEYRGQRAGAIGDIGSFSFQASKNLNSGEGGILTTNDPALAEMCRSIHNCGRVPGGMWYEHHHVGGNYRLSEFQAAILDCQLDRLEEQIARREENGRRLAVRLSQLPGVHPQRRIEGCDRHAWHLFLFRLDPGELGVSREVFLKALSAEGIPSHPGYPLPLYDQVLFAKGNFGPYTGCRLTAGDVEAARRRCPQCERVCRVEGAWLPHPVLLGKQADTDQIADAFEKVVAGRDQLRDESLLAAGR